MNDEHRKILIEIGRKIDEIQSALEPIIKAERKAVNQERWRLGSFAPMADTSTLDALDMAYDHLTAAADNLDDAGT